jgi:hypothetical protein
LKINHFVGTSENAVRIQIMVALIAFLLLRLAHEAYKNMLQSPLAFARVIQTTLIERQSIAELIRTSSRPKREPLQAIFEFDASATRAARQRRTRRACAPIQKAA